MGDANSWLIFLSLAGLTIVLAVTILVSIVTVLGQALVSSSSEMADVDCDKPDPCGSNFERAKSTDLIAKKADNRFQALFILSTVMISSPSLAIAAALNPQWGLTWTGGALFGLIAGLIVGLVVSGFAVMLFLAKRTLRR